MNSENIPTDIDGFEIPTDPTEIQEWYSDAAAQVAMLDGDDLNGRASRSAHRELAAARRAMQAAGIEPRTKRRFGGR